MPVTVQRLDAYVFALMQRDDSGDTMCVILGTETIRTLLDMLVEEDGFVCPAIGCPLHEAAHDRKNPPGSPKGA